MTDLEKTTIYRHRDGATQQMFPDAARWYVHQNRDWTMQPPPPPDWNREIPKYYVSRDLIPPPKARYRLESPLTSIMDDRVWQYCDNADGYRRGSVILTRAWPHSAMIQKNFIAEQILKFFNDRPKSRWRSHLSTRVADCGSMTV